MKKKNDDNYMTFTAAPTVSPEIMMAIGEFVVFFAEIEYSLKLGIHTLLECPLEQKRIITADKNVTELTRMLRALYTKSENQRVSVELIQELCKQADGLREFRNRMMHSTLTGIDHMTIELEKRRGKDYRLQIVEVSLSELEDKIKEAGQVAGEFTAIWMGYYERTPRAD